MLPRRADSLPSGDYLYEPKRDGFRCLAFRQDGQVDLRSRNDRPLAHYFHELVDELPALHESGLVLDGEIIVAGPGGPDFDALLGRIHPPPPGWRDSAATPRQVHHLRPRQSNPHAHDPPLLAARHRPTRGSGCRSREGDRIGACAERPDRLRFSSEQVLERSLRTSSPSLSGAGPSAGLGRRPALLTALRRLLEGGVLKRVAASGASLVFGHLDSCFAVGRRRTGARAESSFPA
jgi:hypothetical protein